MSSAPVRELERLIASCPNDARRHGAARRLAIRLRPLCVKRKPPIEAEPGGADPMAAPIWARLSGRAAMGPLLWSPEVRSSPSFRHGKSYPVLWETGGHHPWARPSAIASNSALSGQSLSPRHPFWQRSLDPFDRVAEGAFQGSTVSAHCICK
jgi:hypothetical protein